MKTRRLKTMPESIWKRFRLRRKDVLYSISDKAHKVYKVDKGAIMERYPSLSGNCYARMCMARETFSGKAASVLPEGVQRRRPLWIL